MVNTLKNTADETMADCTGKHIIWERESNSGAASMKACEMSAIVQ